MKTALAVVVLLLAAGGRAAAVPVSAEAHVGLGLDGGSAGDLASYLTVEPAGRFETLHCGWITVGLAGSLAIDTLAFDRSGGNWQRMDRRLDRTIHLAPSLGFRWSKGRVRFGPWLLITNRDRRRMAVSLLPYGNALVEWTGGQPDIRWFIRAYDQAPYASSGSGIQVGRRRSSWYGPFSEVSWSGYLTPPLLLGVSTRHHLARGPRRALVLGASAGYDLGERLATRRGLGFELMVSVGMAWAAF
jgi:hypothetical protein